MLVYSPSMNMMNEWRTWKVQWSSPLSTNTGLNPGHIGLQPRTLPPNYGDQVYATCIMHVQNVLVHGLSFFGPISNQSITFEILQINVPCNMQQYTAWHPSGHHWPVTTHFLIYGRVYINLPPWRSELIQAGQGLWGIPHTRGLPCFLVLISSDSLSVFWFLQNVVQFVIVDWPQKVVDVHWFLVVNWFQLAVCLCVW